MIPAGSSFCELIRPIPSSLLDYEEEDSSEEEMESAGTAFQRIIAHDTTDACEIIVSTLNPYSDTRQKVRFQWALSLSKSTVKEGFFIGVFESLHPRDSYFRFDPLSKVFSRIKIVILNKQDGDYRPHLTLLSNSTWRCQKPDLEYLSECGRLLVSVRQMRSEEVTGLYEKSNQEGSFQAASLETLNERVKTYSIQSITYKHLLSTTLTDI